MIPQPPLWALEAGLPRPEDREEFDDYWLRVGFTSEELDEIHDGLERVPELAHVRVATLLQQRCPETFRHYVDRRMFAWHPSGVSPAKVSAALTGGVT